jgi:hypothetical protein
MLTRFVDFRHQDFPSWGQVDKWDDTGHVQATVNTVLLKFANVSGKGVGYSQYLHGRGHPRGGAIDGLFESIDSWFELVRTWTQALVNQLLDPVLEGSAVRVTGDGLHVVAIDSDDISIPTTSHSYHITMIDNEALSKPHWRYILRQASQRVGPPVEYSLLDSAAIAFRLSEFRRTVIDASTAVEVSLAQLFEADTSGISPPLRDALRKERRTLGPLVKLVSASHTLPISLSSGLVEVRNKVVHQNYSPQREEARRALDLARKVVKLVKPLPAIQ